ncbi:hypothetical protein [Bacillus sp. FJAT-45350]|uniref:hypothetical protein n=1 Tax=Bacillus sp. FJAT-45350 TaxID=2011014 RepID=UPI000BB749E0|nr:hypothetical protein [Bacillus sp. FJAT-45350]
MRLLILLVIILVVGLITGCYSSNEDRAIILNSEVLTTEKTLPSNFYEIADQGVFVTKVTNQKEFIKQSDMFGVTVVPSEINWNNQVVFFVGMIESGTCPLELDAIGINSDKTEMIIHLKVESEDKPCTDDATPRTKVIAVDAEEVSDVTVIKIDNLFGISPLVELAK